MLEIASASCTLPRKSPPVSVVGRQRSRSDEILTRAIILRARVIRGPNTAHSTAKAREGTSEPFSRREWPRGAKPQSPLQAILSTSPLAILAAFWASNGLRPDAQFDGVGAEGASLTGALGAVGVPTFGGIVDGAGADADALAAGSAAPFLVHTTRPKREALWKLPW